MPTTRNSAFVKFKLEGLDELNAVVKDLPEAIRSRVLAEGVRMGAKPLVEVAKRMAPKRTGALRKSITAVVRTRKNKGTAVAVVGPSTQYFRSGKKLKKGQNKQGADKPSNYAHLVEFGHQNGRGTGRTPAHPFMRPAVIATRQIVGVALAAGISRGLIKEVKRLVRVRK